MTGNIKVVCRFRPPNAAELKDCDEPVVELDEDGISVKIRTDGCYDVDDKEVSENTSFTFDRIFGPESTQRDVFDYSIRSTVEDVLKGYNGTVFAYGQTGSGKTYTMMGNSDAGDELKGIIPRIVESIFTDILSSPDTLEYTVNVSYMEIYMERIRDLLNPRNDNLSIHEEKNRGIYVKGLLEVYVSSIEEVYQVMRQGSSSRAVAHTNMNAESSRSHSIFVITIHQKNLLDGGSLKRGKLYLVDLAGSEKVGKTGASGQTLEEAKKINRSLSSLGMVINALTDGKSAHIPYRVAGGNSRTTLIINCSPASYNLMETLGTLRFGMRAKKIRNKAKINQDLSPAELKALLKKAKAQILTFLQYIQLLEKELNVWRSGGTVPRGEQAALDRIPPGSAPLHMPHEPLTAPSLPPTPAAAPPSESSPTVLTDSSRPWTPMLLAEDEREEFLARENALMDTLSEREDEIARLQKQLEGLRASDDGPPEGDKALLEEISATKALNDKLKYENEDLVINCDTLEDHVKQLQCSLNDALLKISQLESDRSPIDKRKERTRAKRVAKIARIMAQPSGTKSISSQEQVMRDTIAQLKKAESEDYLTPAQVAELKAESMELRFQVLVLNRQLEELREDNEMYRIEHLNMSNKLKSFEKDYESLLANGINSQLESRNVILQFQERLQANFDRKLEDHASTVADMKRLADNKAAQAQQLSNQVEELMKENNMLKSDLVRAQMEHGAKERIQQLSEDMSNQLEEFQTFKAALAAELEERCARIAALESILEETQKEYQSSLSQTHQNARHKRRMDILESHLEALVTIHKELSSQNTKLKKDLVTLERKLTTRNDRISSLERLLEDSQSRFKAQAERFELQLKMITDKSDQRNRHLRASLNPADQPTLSPSPPADVPKLHYSRIAKPMRGGATGPSDITNQPTATQMGTSRPRVNQSPRP
ncbi:hypothetical protein L0F63_001645 [Massospora cicadina]|nr:hypothetical protein L0F63_001645 [Massospora cicadina]